MKEKVTQRARRAPRTGTVVSLRKGGRTLWAARILLKDGTRKQIRCAVGATRESAEKDAARWQLREDTTNEQYLDKQRKAGAPVDGESANDWHERFLDSRKGVISGIRDARWTWGKWISPTIGTTPMAAVTSVQIETIRDLLDTSLKTGAIRAMTARNCWSILTTAFKACVGSKQRDLRVRSDNPCTGVEAPERGESRRKCWLYPSEVAKLLACEDVPREFRELYAVSAYLYLRPGELHELRFLDLDLTTGHVHIARAYEWEGAEVGEPKTRNGIRTIPIPATLMPLLERMRVGASDDALVVPAMQKAGKREAATILRKHLALAGVTHPRLLRDDDTFMPVGFRSFRDSGITWLALEGVDLAKIKLRAGHDDIETSMGYVKAAEDFSTGGVGTPFGPLPPSLLGSVTASVTKTKRAENKGWVDRDLKPGETISPSEVSLESVNLPSVVEQFRPIQNEGAAEITPAVTLGAEGALSLALAEAAKAGRFDIVAQLARELEARRLAGSNVRSLQPGRKKDGRS